MNRPNKFRSISDVYATGEIYEYSEPEENHPYNNIYEAYSEVYIIKEAQGLYAPQLNKWKLRRDDRLDNFIKKLEDREKFVSVVDNEDDIGPIDYDPNWLERISKLVMYIHRTSLL